MRWSWCDTQSKYIYIQLSNTYLQCQHKTEDDESQIPIYVGRSSTYQWFHEGETRTATKKPFVPRFKVHKGTEKYIQVWIVTSQHCFSQLRWLHCKTCLGWTTPGAWTGVRGKTGWLGKQGWIIKMPSKVTGELSVAVCATHVFYCPWKIGLTIPQEM